MKNPYNLGPEDIRSTGHVVQFYVSNEDWLALHILLPRKGAMPSALALLYSKLIKSIHELSLNPSYSSNELTLTTLIEGVTFPQPNQTTPNGDDGRGTPRVRSNPPRGTSVSSGKKCQEAKRVKQTSRKSPKDK